MKPKTFKKFRPARLLAIRPNDGPVLFLAKHVAGGFLHRRISSPPRSFLLFAVILFPLFDFFEFRHRIYPYRAAVRAEYLGAILPQEVIGSFQTYLTHLSRLTARAFAFRLFPHGLFRPRAADSLIMGLNKTYGTARRGRVCVPVFVSACFTLFLVVFICLC